MSNNVVRAFPMAAPPQPSQQDWVWDGANWNWCGCPPVPCPPTPPPCPPSGFPTPCPPWFPPPSNQAPWYPGANGGVSFSATPPVNPIRGNFWWDGVMLHLFDGAAWVNIGPGASGAGGGGTSVGTSPPTNPASGTTWWNGTDFQVWDGIKWDIVGPVIPGVTDGSSAAPGIIGEFVVTTVTIPFSGSPNITTVNVTTITLSPGDWDVTAGMQFGNQVDGMNAHLSPVPTGFSNNLAMYSLIGGAPAFNTTYPVSQPARANLVATTSLAFAVSVYQNLTTGLAAGNAFLTVSARRRR